MAEAAWWLSPRQHPCARALGTNVRSTSKYAHHTYRYVFHLFVCLLPLLHDHLYTHQESPFRASDTSVSNPYIGPFFAELGVDPERAKRWTGLRQDSGDPKQFVLAAKQLWQKTGIDPKCQ